MLLVSSPRIFQSRDEVWNELQQSTLVAADTETVSEDNKELLCISLAISPDTSIAFSSDDEDISKVWSLLEKIPSVWHNVLFDVFNLESAGHHINWIDDTMLMAQAQGYPAKLGDLSFPFSFSWKAVQSLLYNEAGVKIKKKTLKDCAFKDIAEICNMHSIGTYKIYSKIENDNASYHLDKEILPIVLAMQRRGIRLDKELLRKRNTEYKGIVDDLKDVCVTMLHFNPASPRSIGIALSEQGIITSFSSKGNMRTGEEALLSLMETSEIAKLTLKYREKHTLYATFIKPFLDRERIYPVYHVVRTGRFAGSKPNPQNIPEHLRDQYLPDAGEIFWDADASQIEPRIMAWFSKDKKMMGDLATGDIYLPIAQRYNIKRYTAKQLVLASSYGAGESKLVETSHRHGDNISYEDAKTLLHAYYDDYHEFRDWKDEIERQAARDGYITTWMGRKRTLESMEEGEEEGYEPLLKVVNSIVQGTAAEILKLAMVRLAEYKIATTIHDELLLSVITLPDAHILDNLCEMAVLWDVTTGKNWLDLHAVIV